jgi:uncharacterized protein DUF3631
MGQREPLNRDPEISTAPSRAEIDPQLDAAERAGDPNAFLEALRQLPVAAQVRELGRWIPLLATRPEIEWDVWLEHARSTAALKLNVRKARIELAKWALLYEALAPLNAPTPSSLTAESLAGAIAQVAGTALKQRPPDGMSMAQWLDFVKAQTIPRVFAFSVEGNRSPHWDEAINAAFDHVTKIAAVAIDATAGQGEEIRLANPEPWSEPVDGVGLLDALVAAIRRFIVQSDAGAVAVVLYVVLAHVYDSFDLVPMLVFASPVKRCGKTRLLSIVQHLVPKPLLTTNITVAAVFRTISLFAPTLLMDEADTFIKASDELRGVLNSGHTRVSAYTVRLVGDDHEPRKFRTWCPKIIALIGRLADTLEDRSVIVPMKRRTRSEHVERLRLTALPRELEPLLRQTARWARDHEAALRELDPPVPEELHDRAADNWRPLIAIADLVGGPWPQRARDAALALSGDPDTETDDSDRFMLLADLRELFIVVSERPTEHVLQGLNALVDRPWPQWNRGRPMTARQLASMLKPFGVKPRQLTRPINVKGYRAVDLRDAFTRYLPPLEVPRPGGEAVDPKYPKSALETDHLARVPDPKPPAPASDAASEVTYRKGTQTSDTSAAAPGAPPSTSVPSAPVPRTPLRLPGPPPKREPG